MAVPDNMSKAAASLSDALFGMNVCDYEVVPGGIYSGEKRICAVPIVPTAIMENIGQNTEKIELTFFKFGRKRSVIVPRSTIASKTSVLKLADNGMDVTSENATGIIKYLSNILNYNMEVIPRHRSSSVMGWSGDDFMPYCDDIHFDGEDTFGEIFRAISSRGALDEWADYMRGVRKNLEMRLCMAASFASPLIELVGQNSFVMHLWGSSGCGKTVALMVAMSIWGDPSAGKLVRTMNATPNAMMSTAAFLRNLPFAGDELQTIKTQWGNYDTLIMRLAEGIDRGRMSFDKLNESKSWKCSFLFSGEEPCTKADSGGGVKNRVIEIECKGKIAEKGNETANFTRTHYGTAGPVFIEKVKSHPVEEEYSELFDMLLSETKATDKQAGSMAIMMLADRIASELFWPEEDPLTVDMIRPYIRSEEEVDVAIRAYDFICSSIAENVSCFNQESKQVWGDIDGDTCYINKTVLRRLLDSAGFDIDAVKKRWLDLGYTELFDGKYSKTKRIGRVLTRCFVLKLPVQSESDFSEIDAEDELPFEKP